MTMTDTRSVEDLLEPFVRQILELRRQEAALQVARASTEEAMLAATRQAMDAGWLATEDLDEVFYATKGLVLKGFEDRWWNAIGISLQKVYVAAVHRRRRRARSIPNGPNGSWVGTNPMSPTDPLPERGTPVVYVLYKAGQPVYVGSTADLQKRLWFHARWDKDFDYWMATKCKDREAAYALEERLHAEHLPPLNKKVGR